MKGFISISDIWLPDIVSLTSDSDSDLISDDDVTDSHDRDIYHVSQIYEESSDNR